MPIVLLASTRLSDHLAVGLSTGLHPPRGPRSVTALIFIQYTSAGKMCDLLYQPYHTLASYKFSLGGVLHKAAEGKGSGHLRVGDPRPPASGRRLRQVQRALGVVHQSDPEEQARGRGVISSPPAVPRPAAAVLATASAV